MDIPNLVYKSLDVTCIVFCYNYKCRERDDVGTCCNIYLGTGCNTAYNGTDIMCIVG